MAQFQQLRSRTGRAADALSGQSRQRFAIARMLSSAVASQALLSAASFAIGLILIRRTSNLQYGYYILASNAILLLVSLQSAFFNPPIAIRITKLDRLGRGELIGGLYREQYRILPVVGGLTIVAALCLWYARVLDSTTGPLALVTIAAALALLRREFFRTVLLAHRRPQDVLRTDIVYIALLTSGVFVATLTRVPAFAAVVALSFAGLATGFLLSRRLHRHEPWNTAGMQGILRDIAPLAAWSTAGAAIHWTFSQGYIYLVAGTLDVAAVATLAATRLLLMPVTLLSTGIGSLMLPLASGWLHRHGARLVRRRLYWLALGFAAVALGYFGVLWWLRDWIFAVILKKQFEHRDTLLLLWGAIFLASLLRDQLLYLPAAQGRFRALAVLTLVSAVLSLTASYWGMLRFGVAGALVGVLIGELLSVTGIVILSAHEPRQLLTVPAQLSMR
jgi:O-antigen/teichoic acid export membrane protein